AGVAGGPDIGASDLAGGRQRVAARAIGAVTADRHRAGVHGAGGRAVIERQRERDRAGLVITARQHGRVANGRGRGAQGEAAVGTGGGGQCWVGLAVHGLLGGTTLVVGAVLVAVAAVASRPGVGAGHGAGGRQRVAGGVDAIAADGVGDGGYGRR